MRVTSVQQGHDSDLDRGAYLMRWYFTWFSSDTSKATGGFLSTSFGNTQDGQLVTVAGDGVFWHVTPCRPVCRYRRSMTSYLGWRTCCPNNGGSWLFLYAGRFLSNVMPSDFIRL